MMATCQECVHFENGMCKLKPGACLNYDHFQWYPMIMISPSDLENKYVSRISYDSLLKRAKAAEAKVAELEADAKRFKQIIDELGRKVAELREAVRWIPMSERLPKERDEVLALDRTGTVYHWEYSKSLVNIFVADYTHWMLLPQPPQEEK